jgi:hypothetical protein
MNGLLSLMVQPQYFRSWDVSVQPVASPEQLVQPVLGKAQAGFIEGELISTWERIWDAYFGKVYAV